MKNVFLFLLMAVQANSSETRLFEKFYWGVANSAFQVEGSPADSNWYRWTHTQGKIKDGTNADVATDFWNRYAEDFALAKELGANSFRISIAWDRIEPRKDSWDESAIEAYEKMLVSMRSYNLEPVVTLLHSSMPYWLEETGGLLSKDFQKEFSEYALKVVDRLSRSPAKVVFWITFNEPTTYAQGAYVDGVDPPGYKDDLKKFMKAIKAQSQSHVTAVRKIRDAGISDPLFSVAQDWVYFQIKRKWNPMDRLMVSFSKKIYNRGFIDPIRKREKKDKRKYLDFLGINYYTRNIISFSPKSPFVIVENGDGDQSDSGMEVYPEGLEKALIEASKYKLPIFITENGLADSKDRLRSDFIKNHVDAVLRAKAKGVNIFGYLFWSLTDNFEWSSGFEQRFGLVEIDYQSLKRTPRSSFYFYRDLISEMKNKGFR